MHVCQHEDDTNAFTVIFEEDEGEMLPDYLDSAAAEKALAEAITIGLSQINL